MLKNRIGEIVGDTLKKLGIETEGFTVERPAQAEYGDYATNAVLRSGSPELAERLADAIAKHRDVEKAKALKGFVNIFLKPQVWREELRQILELRETYAHLTLGRERTVNVEFISANPTGELHVGNGRGAFFGDVLANVLEKAGYNVEREYYVNDAKNSVQIQELGKTALGRGEAYKSDYLSQILKNLRKELEGITDESEAGYLAAQRILENIKLFVGESLSVRIDRWFSENELYETNQIEAAKQKVPTYEKDGATWVKTTDFDDDDDRVLIRSDGTPGYFLADIAYHLDKAKRADILIDIWGADHQGHVKRMYAIGKHLGFAGKLQILISQVVHIKDEGKNKKMSKRAGETVSLKWLVDQVGLDATRFFYLSKALSTHMDFDIALAREQSQKNPVYYVQYSYARSNQIFEKLEARSFDLANADLSLIKEEAELALIKKLAEYPEVIESIVAGYEKSKSYDLQKLTSYAYELSAAYHRFYETSRVLVTDEKLKNARLALVRAYQIILKDCLLVMGIGAPDKM